MKVPSVVPVSGGAGLGAPAQVRQREKDGISETPDVDFSEAMERWIEDLRGVHIGVPRRAVVICPLGHDLRCEHGSIGETRMTTLTANAADFGAKTSAVKRFWQRMVYHRTVRALEELPDRSLEDIGVARSEIKDHARKAAGL